MAAGDVASLAASSRCASRLRAELDRAELEPPTARAAATPPPPAPVAEPPAAPPDSLAALQALALPPSPPPPQPSKRDLPRLAQSIFLAAAQPEQHTLAVASDEVWYGTLARDEIVLGAMQVAQP